MIEKWMQKDHSDTQMYDSLDLVKYLVFWKLTKCHEKVEVPQDKLPLGSLASGLCQ